MEKFPLSCRHMMQMPYSQAQTHLGLHNRSLFYHAALQILLENVLIKKIIHLVSSSSPKA